MKKQSLLIFTSLCSMLLVTGCNSNSKRPYVDTFESKKLYLFHYNSESESYEKSTEQYIVTHYINGSSIPYLSVKDYVEGFLGEDNISYLNGYTYSYESGKGEVKLNTDSFDAKAIINIDAQTLTYNTYSGFLTSEKGASNPMYSIMTSGEYLFKDLKYNLTKGKEFTIDLTKYNIKAYLKSNEIYLPYHVCLTAFGSYLKTLTYTGSGYYIVPSSHDEEEQFQIIKKTRDTIGNNAFNTEYMNYAYDHLAFTFDNFFGLDKRPKRTGNKDDYYYFKDGAYAALEKYKKDLASTSFDVSNEALAKFYDECVNDGGHSGYEDYNLFATKKMVTTPTGELGYTNKITNLLAKARVEANLQPSKFGKDFTGYVQTIDNVLFVTMDEFLNRDNGKCTSEHFSDEEYGKCAITVLGRANEEISKNSNIKNVVLDMSCNGGGAGFMPLQILSWINKGNMSFAVKNKNDGSILQGSGHADINLDGAFDEKDYLADDINVYFICSPASFSSGNYVNCLASEVSKAKFIGERSGGGSCNIDTKINVYGSSMRTSGFIQLCFSNPIDGQYVSDEVGVTPSYYPISLDNEANASKFYDRQSIVNKILSK